MVLEELRETRSWPQLPWIMGGGELPWGGTSLMIYNSSEWGRILFISPDIVTYILLASHGLGLAVDGIINRVIWYDAKQEYFENHQYLGS